MSELNPSRKSPLRAALMAAAVVAGCGGGGSSGGGNVLPPPPPPGAINWGSVVALGGGEFYATWLQNSNGALQLRGKRFTGSAWLATSQRIDNRDDWAARVSLVGGPTGTAWVAWEQGGLLFAARYNPATGNWTHPIPVGASLAGVPQALRAAVDGGGNAVLAWVQRDVGTAEDLYYTTIGSTASVAGPPVLLETEAGPVIGALALAVNTTGVAVIARRCASARCRARPWMTRSAASRRSCAVAGTARDQVRQAGRTRDARTEAPRQGGVHPLRLRVSQLRGRR
jgi:hypothetical protein